MDMMYSILDITANKSDANEVAIFSNYLTAIPAMVPLRAARPRVVTRVIA